MLTATLFTLFVVPVAYDLLARRTGSPGDVERQLEAEAAASQSVDEADSPGEPLPPKAKSTP